MQGCSEVDSSDYLLCHLDGPAASIIGVPQKACAASVFAM